MIKLNFTKLIQAVPKAAQAIAAFTTNLFKDARKRIKLAVQITQWLKIAVDSGLVVSLTAIFPGTASFRDKASKRLAEVLRYLELLDNITFISQKTITAVTGPDRKSVLTAIAAELASRDLKIDYDSAEAQTQLIYKLDPEFAKAA